MNIKLRLKNKATLTALILALIALVYKVLEILHITPPVEQQELINLAEILIGIMVILGITVDPTTEGIGDSAQAMTYTEPKKKKKEGK